MFIANNHASFHVWWKENLFKHQIVSNIWRWFSTYFCGKSNRNGNNISPSFSYWRTWLEWCGHTFLLSKSLNRDVFKSFFFLTEICNTVIFDEAIPDQSVKYCLLSEEFLDIMSEIVVLSLLGPHFLNRILPISLPYCKADVGKSLVSNFFFFFLIHIHCLPVYVKEELPLVFTSSFNKNLESFTMGEEHE